MTCTFGTPIVCYRTQTAVDGSLEVAIIGFAAEQNIVVAVTNIPAERCLKA
jgi:hypothetical protein